MNIGLDYDDTYTRDPALWDKFIALFRVAGHSVYITTWRYDKLDENMEVKAALKDKVNGIYFTGRIAKETFMFGQGIRIDVWIDDNPWTILNSQKFE